MFDIAPTELLLCAVVALVVIGPKDLPKAMRVLGHWMARARAVARHFRSGIDTMIRESELAEMEKKWAEENARIMREHPIAAEEPRMLPLADAPPAPSPPAPKPDDGER
jgi:sec-independent protein translocase protein TatB